MTTKTTQKSPTRAHFIVINDAEGASDSITSVIEFLGNKVDVYSRIPVALDVIQSHPNSHQGAFLLMPCIKAQDTSRKIRAISKTLPIVIITGELHACPPEQMEALGISMVLEKPFQYEDLVEAITVMKAPDIKK